MKKKVSTWRSRRRECEKKERKSKKKKEKKEIQIDKIIKKGGKIKKEWMK